MIKTILFDLNKVLVILKQIDEDYQKVFGISQAEFWKPRKRFLNDYVTGKINLDQFLLSIMEINGLNKNKLSEAKKLHEKNLSLIPGMEELLRSLQKNYSLILAAGDGKESLDMKLKKFDLAPYFNKIYATCYIGLLKSDTNFYKEILHKSNLNPKETLFIDDQEPHLNAAKKLGIHTILFENLPKLKKDLKIRFDITV